MSGAGRAAQHPISGRIVWYWRDILSAIGVPEGHTLAVKIPYAAMGAASFVAFAHIYYALFKTWRAWLFAGLVSDLVILHNLVTMPHLDAGSTEHYRGGTVLLG